MPKGTRFIGTIFANFLVARDLTQEVSMYGDIQQITDPVVILKVLKNAESGKFQGEIWQPISATKKRVFDVKILRLTPDELFFYSQKDLSELDQDKLCYCFIADKMTVFKSKINFLSEYKLSLTIPDQIIQREQRKWVRSEAMNHDERLLYQYGKQRFSNKGAPHSAQILNYSEAGIAIKLTTQSTRILNIGDSLSCQLPYSDNTTKIGVIRHLSPMSDTHIIVGLEFL